MYSTVEVTHVSYMTHLDVWYGGWCTACQMELVLYTSQSSGVIRTVLCLKGHRRHCIVLRVLLSINVPPSRAHGRPPGVMCVHHSEL